MTSMEHMRLVDSLARYASECDHCVYNTCLGDAAMQSCGQACLDCAEICRSTAILVSRGSQFAHHWLAACADACNECASVCEQYPDSEAMRRCARVCRDCAKECMNATPMRRAA